MQKLFFFSLEQIYSDIKQYGFYNDFRYLLYKDCLDWIKIVTNIPMDENTIDMSCAKYTNTGENCYDIAFSENITI